MHRPLAFLVVTAAVVASLAGCGGGGSSSADIAFVSSRDGDYAIYVMSADGKGERRLTKKDQEGVTEGESVFFQIDPAWSPDATKIAYASVRAGSPDIYVMNADGTGDDTAHVGQGERHAPHVVARREVDRVRARRGHLRHGLGRVEPAAHLGHQRPGVRPGVVTGRRVDRVRASHAGHARAEPVADAPRRVGRGTRSPVRPDARSHRRGRRTASGSCSR